MAKTKALVSCAVAAQLICVFVIAYANRRVFHSKAQIVNIISMVTSHAFGPELVHFDNRSLILRFCAEFIIVMPNMKCFIFTCVSFFGVHINSICSTCLKPFMPKISILSLYVSGRRVKTSISKVQAVEFQKIFHSCLFLSLMQIL